MRQDYIQISPAPNKYVYFPSERTTQIFYYNYYKGSAVPIDLSGTVSHSFIDIGLCLLENGMVMISGGGRYPYYRTDSYLLNPSSYHCLKLSNMIVPKCKHTLIMNKNFVYSFGGNNGSFIKTVEMYDIYKNRWSLLRDMKHARMNCACIAVEDSIFIWGGDFAKSVEIFSVKSKRCRISRMPSISILVNAFVKDDKVYILSKKHLQIFDKNLSLLDTKSVQGSINTWTKSTLLLLPDSLIAYNKMIDSIERFQLSSCTLSTLKSHIIEP